MLKTNFIKLFFSGLMLAATTYSNAQTIIWGAGSTDPVADTVGRFALPFGSSSNAWTAVSVFHGNVSGCTQVLPGNAFWTRSTTGRSQGAYWNNRPAINSTTMADGVALFDSDYLDNNGTPTFNSGTAPTGYNCGGTVPGHRGELHSPTFDLSGYTDSTLSARFYLYYRPFTIRELTLGVSTDNGATWTDFDITQGVAANADFAPAWVEVPLFGVLDGVANLTQCKIRFTFEGYYYFAMVDDISLVKTPDYDFAISGQTSGTTLGDGFVTSITSDYRYSPFTQQDVSNFFFTARVTNYGSKTIFPANNARIDYILEKGDGAGGWTTVHTGTIPVDTVAPQDLITPTEQMFPNINMIDTFATYRGTIIAAHDLADGKHANDTLRHTFAITDKYYSKCRLSATDNQVFANRPIFPGAGAGNTISEFEYGSMFWFPRGAADSVILDSVSFRAYASSSLVAGFDTASVVIRVYEFNDLNGNGTLEQSPTSGELTLVGLGTDNVPMTAGQYVHRTASVIDINSGTFGPLYLKDTTVYLVSLEQTNAAGLTSGTQYRCAWYGADELNYSINAAVLAAGSKPRHTAPVRVAQIGATPSNNWNWVGFGADIQPSIRLILSGKLNPFAVTPVAVDQQNQLAAGMELFPNPTNSQINLKVSFDKEMTNVSYILSSVNGQIIDMATRSNVQQEVYSFDVQNLPAGVYFMSVRTQEGVKTQRFVKQ